MSSARTLSTRMATQPTECDTTVARPALFLRRAGSRKPTCILIHGFADGSFVWDGLAATLAPLCEVLAMDLRGHGLSEWDPQGRYGTRGFTDDIAALIDRLRLSEFVLVGHSLGAQIAVHLRARYPRQTRAVVLVDFAPELNSEGVLEAENRVRESLRCYSDTEDYLNWLREVRPLAAPELLKKLATQSLKPAEGGLRLRLDPALVNRDKDYGPQEQASLTQLLRQQACPTLLLRGRGSAVLTASSAHDLLRQLPQGELVTVRAAGHAVMLDNPVAVEQAIVGFLRRHQLAC